MFFNLIYLSWFDIIAFGSFAFAAIGLSIVSKQLQQEKEKEKQNDLDKSSLSSTLPPPSPTDSNCLDEYHEDEDSLSLDNLFPCDQSEIYASKKISYIIEELVQTEANYVDNLKRGMKNYAGIFSRIDLPEPLRGRKEDLLGNIEDVLALHEKQILPMMQRNQRDLKMLFDEFTGHFDFSHGYGYERQQVDDDCFVGTHTFQFDGISSIACSYVGYVGDKHKFRFTPGILEEKNHFYCYVTFTMNKKASMQLRQDHQEYFTTLQEELKDKLGIASFLVQPIQRLTRYPLLLQQFISEFYKTGINCKPVLMSCCKLETRMRNLLSVVNQSEEIKSIEDLNELNILEQGYFRKSSEFDAYNHKSRKKYRCKVFLFDKCLLCTEVRKKRLSYRCHYSWDSIEVTTSNSKSFLVTHKVQNRPEFEFTASEAIAIKQWMRCIARIRTTTKDDLMSRARFTLPMEVVLAVGLVIWFLFRLL